MVIRSSTLRQSAVAVLAVASFALALPACFYIDDLNTRPVVAIQKTSIPALTRGSLAQFRAERFDEDDGGARVAVDWEMHTCGSTISECDRAAFYTGTELLASATIPVVRADGSPVQKLQVVLHGVDPQGAQARPTAMQLYDVGNAVPAITLQTFGYDGYPVGIPFSIRTRVVDADDVAANIQVQWKVYSPAGSADPALVLVPPDQSRPNESAYTLTPDLAGTWTIEVTAIDSIGATSVEHIDVQVAADRPPCLGSVTPLPAPASNTAIVDVAQRFAVQVVDDDLDIFPAPVGDPFIHESHFAWSIQSPLTNGVRQPIVGDRRSSIDIDPTQYHPGDVIELRVEISDRVTRTLACADGAATCSLNSNACIQRQTWRLEVR